MYVIGRGATRTTVVRQLYTNSPHEARYRNRNIPEWMTTACDIIDLARDVSGHARVEGFGESMEPNSYTLFATQEKNYGVKS